jgi:hypothetical protein
MLIKLVVAIVVFRKAKVNLHGNNQDLMDYPQHLTPYAFGFVTKQYKEMSKISYSGDIYKNTVAISSYIHRYFLRLLRLLLTI